MSSFDYEEIKREAQKLPTLGSVIWWTIQDVSIPRDTLEELFQEAEIPKDWMPPKVTPFQALKKAIEKAQIGSGYMFRPILHNEEKIVYGVVKESKKQEEETLEYNVINKIILYSGNGISLDNDNVFPAGIIRDYFNHFSNIHTSDDIRKMLLKILKDHFYCTAIRESGGVYFIASKFDEMAEKLELLIPKISSTSKLYLLGIVDTQKSKTIIFELFREELVKEIGVLFREADEIDKNNVQARVINNRLDVLSLIEKKIRLYEKFLEGDNNNSKDMLEAVEICRKKFETKRPFRVVY